MSDEMNADSVEEVEVEQTADPLAEPEFDMEAAQDELAQDLFGKQPEKEEPDDDIELEMEEPQEEPEQEAEAEEPQEEEEPEVEMLERPASWKKDMDETWKSMSKEAQEYVIAREEQMKKGVEMNRADSDVGRTIRDTISPYKHILEQQGVDEAQLAVNMIGAHLRLTTGSQQEKDQLFRQMAQSYGVNLEGSEPVEGEDPRIAQLQNELQYVRNQINQTQQQTVTQMQKEVNDTVEAFAKDHEHFEELADDIAKFINAGFDLEDAYDKAVWASPVHRQQALDKIRQDEAEKLKAETKKRTDKAKQAKSVNVKSRDTGKAPTAPTGTMDDTLNEVYREISNRT